VLSYIALFRWFTPPAYLASKVIAPLSYMLFFVVLGTFATGKESASFYIIGNSVQMAAMSGIYGVTMSIGGDRWDGTLPYLFATPANRLALFVGRAAIHVLDGILGVFLGLFWGITLLGLDVSKTDPLVLSVVILITTFSTSGFGLLLGALSLLTRNIMFVNNTVFFLLLIFSGANLNLSLLPEWMQTISWSLPLTRGIASARKIISGSAFIEIAPLMGTEFLIGVLYILLGFLLFRWFEFKAKRKGTLEVM